MGTLFFLLSKKGTEHHRIKRGKRPACFITFSNNILISYKRQEETDRQLKETERVRKEYFFEAFFIIT